MLQQDDKCIHIIIIKDGNENYHCLVHLIISQHTVLKITAETSDGKGLRSLPLHFTFLFTPLYK